MKKGGTPYRYGDIEPSSLEDDLKDLVWHEDEAHSDIDFLFNKLKRIDDEAVAELYELKNAGDGEKESKMEGFIIAVEMFMQLVKNVKGELNKAEIILEDIGILH